MIKIDKMILIYRFDMITKFKLFEEIGFEDYAPTLDFDKIFPKKDIDKKKEMIKQAKEIAKQGNLYNQLASGKRLTFGVLKAIHQDALKFKERRETLNGIYKFLHRAVPIAIAPFFFTVWFASQFLGVTRAFWKIFVPVMLVRKIDYKSYMSGLIEKVMDATEGDIAHFFDDWFYRSFAVEKGLIKMAKKEHIIDFAYKLAEKMEKMPDSDPVPPYYVDNEFRRYLNREFNLTPPIPLKVKK